MSGKYPPGTLCESRSAKGRYALQLDSMHALILPEDEEPYVSMAILRDASGWIVIYDPSEGVNA